MFFIDPCNKFEALHWALFYGKESAAVGIRSESAEKV